VIGIEGRARERITGRGTLFRNAHRPLRTLSGRSE
jgi:hypothetical protein